jgi:hypothetical protein
MRGRAAVRKDTKVTHIGPENPLFSVEADFTQRREDEADNGKSRPSRGATTGEGWQAKSYLYPTK